MRTQSALRSSRPAQAQRLLAAPAAPWVVLAAIVAYAAWYLVIHRGQGLFFFYDEWAFIVGRRGHAPAVFLRPHNEHLSLIPIADWKAMLQLFGLGSYRPYQWMLFGYTAALGVAVYVYARMRIGAWLGLIPATVVLLQGAFWEDTMWPFQVGFIGALVFGVLALLALDRRTLRADVLACIALIISIAHASVGIPILAGVFVDLLLRKQWRRLWVPVIPGVLYLIWKLFYPVKDIYAKFLPHAPVYVYKAAAGTAGSIFGLTREAGNVILVVLVAILIEAIVRRRMTPRAWAFLAMAAAFWIAAALAREDLAPPDSPRYMLPSAVFVLGAAAEIARGLRPRRFGWLLILLILPVSVAVGHDRLTGGGMALHYEWAPYNRADVTALDQIQGQVKIDPNTWQPDPVRAPDIFASRYYSATQAFGKAGESIPKLMQEPDPARALADQIVLIGSATAPVKSQAPPPGAQAPQTTSTQNVTVTQRGPCLLVHDATGAVGAVEVAVPGSMHYRALTGGIGAGMRRWSGTIYGLGAAQPNQWLSLQPPKLASAGTWYAQFTLVPDGRVQICG